MNRLLPRGAILVLSLLPWLVAGCATTGINSGQINIISSEEEVNMGKDFSLEVEKQFEIYENQEVTEYVAGVGRDLAAVCDRRDIDYHFAVIKKDELNAFALPGGYIYIYTGLLKALDDEAQLAGVLAHEIGHVTARHATERLTAMYGYQILVGLVLGEDPNVWAQLVSNIFSTGGFLAYSRRNEYEADRLGTVYVSRAGYDQRGIMELLEKFQVAGEREPSKLEEWLSTHPPTADRITRVRSLIAVSAGQSSQKRNADQYARMKRNLP
ncbi:MAG: M48 family metalloprotease [Candidatus Krumholzibacteriota bacterium]|nr:M48 family metalloprotease [Candidatus Krumholzibacteriota bacterium]